MEHDRSSFHDWREWRRMRAWELSEHDWKPCDIAAALGVGRAAVSRWLAAAAEGGRDALRTRKRVGPARKLLPEQWPLIVDCLWHGAEAYGFRGDAWTCGRVAQVIQEEFGVRYHPGHVSRLLKQLGWTPQVPITRAIQRDEAEIQRWRDEVWPGLKQRARSERRRLAFVDESGFYLLPGVVRTYGLKGHTPVVKQWQTRDHLSVMAGLRTTGQVYTLVRQKALTGLEVVEFLTHLGHQLNGAALVIWDRSPIHRRLEVNEFIAALGARRFRWNCCRRMPRTSTRWNGIGGI